MQKPRYSPQDEQKLMTTLWSPVIRDDPEAFVLFVFPWGQKNTPLEKFKGPRTWQKKLLREIRDHLKANRDAPVMDVLQKAVASGRGIGKSALVSWLILWMLTTRIGSTVVISANTEAQLRKVTWGELTKWVAMAINSHWWEPTATTLTPAQWLTELVERDLKKGTRYWAAEGKLWSEENPDGYAGNHNHDGMMVIFDEASGIPDSIWPVAAGYFTEPILDRYFLAFSNPRRNQGYFYECFNSKRQFWSTDQIDARDVEGTDKAFYEKIVQEYGPDSREARVEVYGEFPEQGDGQFIRPRLVDEAVRRPFYKDKTAPIVVGVDPARGGDKTVIAVRQGRDLIDLVRYENEELMEVVGKVIETIRKYKPTLVNIDEGGLGYGIVDRLKEQGFKVRGVNFGWKSKNPVSWANKRVEMWAEMRDWLKTGSLPDDRQLKTDLTGPKEEFDSSGVCILESKNKMKRRGLASPDSADALAVTFAFAVTTRGNNNDFKPRLQLA
jgi:hypothetical protein